MKLQPLVHPQPGRPLVSRKTELSYIDEVLRKLAEKNIPPTFINFWGHDGIGKSWLLRELEQKYRQNTIEDQQALAVLPARLNLSDIVSMSVSQHFVGPTNGLLLVKSMWQQLTSQSNLKVPDLNDADTLAQMFVEQVKQWLLNAIAVILLDDLDALYEHDNAGFQWFEKHVIIPLLETNKVVFVFTTRSPLNWRPFEIRRRLKSQQITAFSSNEVEQQIQANAEVAAVIFERTAGHPLATEYVARLLEAEGIDLAHADRKLAETGISAELLQTALHPVVEGILAPVPLEERQQIIDAAVLRKSNDMTLGYLFSALSGERFSWTMSNTIEFNGEMVSYALMRWTTEKGYAFIEPVRQVLNSYLQAVDPARFRKAHEAAFEYHCHTVDEFPAYPQYSLQEAVYHAAIIGKTSELLSWWQQFLTRESWRHLKGLRDILTGVFEADKELRMKIGEEQLTALIDSVPVD